jgi:hypothetical protein
VDEQVALRFMLTHGQTVMREMTLGQAVECIDRWKIRHSIDDRFLSEKNGIKSYGVDLNAVVYMDIISLADLRKAQGQPPQVPAPQFGRSPWS